jgi:hypothetical protein
MMRRMIIVTWTGLTRWVRSSGPGRFLASAAGLGLLYLVIVSLPEAVNVQLNQEVRVDTVYVPEVIRDTVVVVRTVVRRDTVVAVRTVVRPDTVLAQAPQAKRPLAERAAAPSQVAPQTRPRPGRSRAEISRRTVGYLQTRIGAATYSSGGYLSPVGSADANRATLTDSGTILITYHYADREHLTQIGTRSRDALCADTQVRQALDAGATIQLDVQDIFNYRVGFIRFTAQHCRDKYEPMTIR